MSILSGLLENQRQLNNALKIAEHITHELMKDPILQGSKFMQLLTEGLSVADILDIPKEKLELAFGYGHQLLAAGEIEKARDIFLTLCQFQPLDERFAYGLAATFQIEGDCRTAGRLYVYYLALNATCAEGRLRLAECFLGAGEYDNARSMFKSALRAAKEEPGNTEQQAYAAKMIAYAKQQKKNSIH